MAVCYIDNIINKNPTLDLRVTFRRAPDHGTVKVRFAGKRNELGQQGPDGPEFVLGEVVEIPPGEELLCQGLGFPWGDEYHITGTVESKRLGRSNVNRFSVNTRSDTLWDYIFHRVNGTLNQQVEAGSLGNVPGINHSHWEMCLEDNGYVVLRCRQRDGLSHKEAVSLIVGLVTGALGIGAGAAALIAGPFAVAAAGTGLAASLVVTGPAGAGAAAVAGAAAAAAATGVAGAAVATAAAVAAAATAGAATASVVVCLSTATAIAAFGSAGLGIAAGMLTIGAVTTGVFCGIWTAIPPVGLPDQQLQRFGQSDVASGRQGSWQVSANKSTWQIDLGKSCSLSSLHFTTATSPGQPDARGDFSVMASNRADMSDAMFLGGSTNAPGELGMFVVDVVDPSPFRYISVVKGSATPFAITKMQAFARPRDLAAGQPVRASSEYCAEHSPDKANDGGSCATGGWSRGATDPWSWWQVDLGRPYALSSVQLVTRQDMDQPEQRQYFQIRASNDPNMGSYVVLATQGRQPRQYKDVFQAIVETTKAYRYIRVAKTAPGDFFIAKFCAYEAGAVDTDIRPGFTLSAAYVPASRTSELFFAAPDGPLARSIDGRVDVASFAGGGNVDGDISAVRGPEVYYRGADGYLHHLSKLDAGPWQHRSFPVAGKVAGDISALFAEQQSHSEAFFRGEDGLVHCLYFRDGQWYCDDIQFRGSGSCLGGLSAFYNVDRRHAELFAAGADGYLHYFWINGGRWAMDGTNFPRVKVSGAVSGLYSPMLRQTEVFFRDDEGYLRHLYVEGGQWRDAQRREVGKIEGDISAVFQPIRNHTEIYFRSADGYLNYCAFGPKAHHDRWAFQVGGKVNGPISAAYNPDRQHTEAHFTGEDGLIHHFYVENGAWQHRALSSDPAAQARALEQEAQARQAELARQAEEERLAREARASQLGVASPTVVSLWDGGCPGLPPDLRLASPNGQSAGLQWGDLTYWTCGYADNRDATCVVAYDSAWMFRLRIDFDGARDISQITVDADARTVTYSGQGAFEVSFDQLLAV